MGSYYGTVNSEDNSVPDVPQIGLQYNHGASLTRLPNDSLASVWQASPYTTFLANLAAFMQQKPG